MSNWAVREPNMFRESAPPGDTTVPVDTTIEAPARRPKIGERQLAWHAVQAALAETTAVAAPVVEPLPGPEQPESHAA